MQQRFTLMRTLYAPYRQLPGLERPSHNKLLALYSCEERQQMVDAVYAVYKHAMLKRFQTTETESKSIYIAPELFDIPINVGDRSSTIQDTSCALIGITLLLAIIIVIKSKAST